MVTLFVPALCIYLSWRLLLWLLPCIYATQASFQTWPRATNKLDPTSDLYYAQLAVNQHSCLVALPAQMCEIQGWDNRLQHGQGTQAQSPASAVQVMDSTLLVQKLLTHPRLRTGCDLGLERLRCLFHVTHLCGYCNKCLQCVRASDL